VIGELLGAIAEVVTSVASWRMFLWIILVVLIILAVHLIVRGSSVPPVIIIGMVGIAAGLLWDWRSRR
jgi:uncharacterized MnhB-related membrane protein